MFTPLNRLFLLHLGLSSFSSSHSATPPSSVSAQLPNIDWSALGHVGLLGSFSGLSIYNSSSSLSNSLSNPSHATLLALSLLPSQPQPLSALATTNDGGTIHTICVPPSSNKIYLGGSFSSLNSVSGLSNIALYDPASATFTPLGHGLDGPVYNIACENSDLVWIGGAFTHPIGLTDPSYGPNIISWSPSASSWKPPPFVGVNGPVWSIQQLSTSSGRSLILGGSFSILLDSPNANTSANSVLSPATRAMQQAGAPSDFNSLGSSLTPISLAQASVSAEPSTSKNGYQTPEKIFCPSGIDGPGSSWQVQGAFDNALFTVELGHAVQAGGIRLGNSFADGGATHGFQVVSIPDNTVLQLTSIDPITNQITTCQTNCTLARDLHIPYEDFLFPPGTSLTGFQLKIMSKYGNVAGLHLVQLLSSGNVAFAINQLNGNNGTACTTGIGAVPGSSSTSSTGTWTETTTNANISGTVQTILTSTVPAGTAPNNAPTLTWSIYVPLSGVYDVSFYTPGCQNMNDCPARSTVDVIVQPLGGDIGPTTVTVDQRNPQDAATVVYNGTLIGSGQSGGLTVTMRLTDTVGSSDAVIVADQILLRAHSTNGTTEGVLSHGLLEFVLDGTGAFGDGTFASGINAASTAATIKLALTAVDTLGTQLNTGVTVKSIVADQQTVFVSGDRLSVSGPLGTPVSSTGTAVRTSSSTTIPNGGLNGNVDSSLILGGYLYVSGNFTATTDGTVVNLGGLARWQYSLAATSWEAFGTKSDLVGQVVQLTAINGTIYAISSGPGNSSPRKSGRSMAVYDPSKSTWISGMSGFFIGNLTAIAGSSDKGGNIYLAGSIISAASFAAPGGALLFTDQSGTNENPTVTPFGFQMNQTSTEIETASDQAMLAGANKLPSLSKRWVHDQERLTFAGGESLMDQLVGSSQLSHHPVKLIVNPTSHQSIAIAPSTMPLIRRQVNSAAPTNASTLPFALTSTPDATVLAGAFWNDDQLVLGGRFVSESASVPVVNVGLYDRNTGQLRPFNGTSQVVGEVLSVKVINNTAWIGGSFVSPSGKAGLDTYDLSLGQWAATNMPSPQPYPNSNVSVRVIASRPGTTRADVIIAGSFGQLGSLPCQSICLRSTTSGQWQSLAGGLRGLVNSIDFAGKSRNILIAAGSFVVNGTMTSHVVRWDFDSTTLVWQPIGDQTSIPGIVKSVVADGNSETNIFVAGDSADGTKPFLMRWDGSSWKDVNQGASVLPGSHIDHLSFVPLKSITSSSQMMTNVNGIETDRMLMVSGALLLEGNVTVSSALYDGSTWYPYFSTVTASGTTGVVSRMVSVADTFRSAARHFRPVGIVILISMAIALGIVFFGVLIGLLIALRMRSKEQHTEFPAGPLEDDDDDDIPAGGEMDGGAKGRSEKPARPTSLLATIDAATAAMTDRMRYLQNRQSQIAGGVSYSPEGKEKGLAQTEEMVRPGPTTELMRDTSPVSTSSHEGRLAATGIGMAIASEGRGTRVDDGQEEFDQRRQTMVDFGVDEDYEDEGQEMEEDDEADLDQEIDIRRARWSFDPQLPGEISVGAGESVEIKDRSNAEWWLVRRADGVEGVVPADWFL